MNRLFAFLFVSCTIFISCTPKKAFHGEVLTIDLTGNLNREKEFFLSGIASDIGYIKLDNSPEAFIGELGKYRITDDYLLIEERTTNSLLLFDRSGGFIRKISRSGKGPGEYGQLQDFTVDSEGKFIYLLTQKRIITCQITGEFIMETPLPCLASRLATFGDDFMLMYNSVHRAMMDNYTIAFFSKDGTMGERLLRRNGFVRKPGIDISATYLYKRDDLWCFNQRDYDTVYAVTPDRKLVAEIYFKNDRQPDDPYFSPDFRLDGWMELPGYILLNGGINHEGCDLVYDRESREIWRTPIDTLTWLSGFINDLDGGLSQGYGIVFGNQIFSLTSGVQMHAQLKKLSGRQVKAILPERRQQLESFIANLSEEDNQILTIVTLKK